MTRKIATPTPIRRQPLVRFCIQALDLVTRALLLPTAYRLLPTAYCLLSETPQVVVTLLEAHERIRALVLLDEVVLHLGCCRGLQDRREVQGTAPDLDKRLRRHALAERLRRALHLVLQMHPRDAARVLIDQGHGIGAGDE